MPKELRETYREAVKALLNEDPYEVLELVLTVPNCDWWDLPHVVEELQKAYARMLKYSAIKRIHVGSLRCIEITVGRDGRAHPHLHVVMIVTPNYGSKRRGGDYIPKDDVVSFVPVGQERRQTVGDGRQYRDSPWQPVRRVVDEGWISLWKRAANLTTDPVVWVQKATRPRRDRKTGEVRKRSVDQAIGHAIKYAVKPPEFKDGIDGEALAWIAEAIHGKRLVEAYGKLRNPPKPEEEEPEAEEEENNDFSYPAVIEVWKWGEPVKDYRHLRTVKPTSYLDMRARLCDVWAPAAWDPLHDAIYTRANEIDIDDAIEETRARSEISSFWLYECYEDMHGSALSPLSAKMKLGYYKRAAAAAAAAADDPDYDGPTPMHWLDRARAAVGVIRRRAAAVVDLGAAQEADRLDRYALRDRRRAEQEGREQDDDDAADVITSDGWAAAVAMQE